MFPTGENDPSVEDISMPVFSEGSSPVVSEPPSLTREQERLNQGTRRPIPVSTIDWQTSMTSHFSPLHGLDFLKDVHQIIIQQTVELTDLMASLESENRYTVKVPRGETIYYATESSTSFQRTCFGSSRAFTMRLYDPTQQEAIQFRRRLACGSCCSVFFYLQDLEVWIPPGEYLGKITQKFNATKPCFVLYNKQMDIIYRIEGPESAFGCMWSKNHNFQIFTSDGLTQIGSIIHQWDQVQVAYNLYMQMPGQENNTRHKALLLGAAFLLEYMYFESAKKRKGCKCIC
ncbi:phospholipid scramblase 1-like isoform X1 [Tribolium madens]|uniref:phospholipid scramblase 1-like isoform X1 n=1 Tax=Tribolium madens TaxID=41895 RepID=UPI001CF71F19|nr:phospholipid scramblase 1-like isoform X1 [Tribolium madens]